MTEDGKKTIKKYVLCGWHRGELVYLSDGISFEWLYENSRPFTKGFEHVKIFNTYEAARSVASIMKPSIVSGLNGMLDEDKNFLETITPKEIFITIQH